MTKDLAALLLAVLSALLCSIIAAAAIEPVCDTSNMMNSAFVFIKPHANTPATQAMVKSKLIDAGIEILSEHDINGETIDKDKLIDQHYYAIASKATILPASQIPVPADKFQQAFGESWETVLTEDRAFNAMDACKRLGCTPDELNEAWQQVETSKFGGGFYCGLINYKNHSPIYVFNAFFMSMRGKFVAPGSSIHCYVIRWDLQHMTWSAFRNDFLGPTDPADAPIGSIRRTILDSFQELGLKQVPNKSDNGVHASASPFEGLAEKINWLKMDDISQDFFGKTLLDAGLSETLVKEWSVDPRVMLSPDGSTGSIFDALEDLDSNDCLNRMVEISKLN